MKAIGPSIAIIRFDPSKSKLRIGGDDQVAYHVARLLTGQETAESEWTHAGLDIRLDDAETPVGLIEAVADYFDDGFHEKLVDRLRDIAGNIATLDR